MVSTGKDPSFNGIWEEIGVLYAEILYGWSISIQLFLSVFSLRRDHRLASSSALLYLISTGMFDSGPALLPNTFSMVLTAFLWAGFLRGKDFLVWMTTILIGIIGWPYALLFNLAPIILTLYKGGLPNKRCLGCACALLSLHLLIERHYYGRWTIPNINAIFYNINPQNPALFGKESLFYYLKNLLLNFNLGLILASSSISFLSGRKLFLLIGLRLGLCIGLFSWQQHKEERFLYPIYPLILLLAGFTTSKIPKMARNLVFATIIIISTLRSVGQFYFYHKATIRLIQSSNIDNAGIICWANDWYRFPTHFLLPDGIRAGFIASSNAVGMLPQYYRKETWGTATHFNSKNEPEPNQFTRPSDCSWFVGRQIEAKELAITKPVKCGLIPSLPSSSSASSTIITTGAWKYWLFPLWKSMQPLWQAYCLYKV